ncbi:MAG TPA: hypothetical protein VK879_13265 [Candidatus Sulfomarinibacteraceae bacterium]|nr:hypothetical protein [Candidatus Sulfomarinibacteraceae bacterium]
MKKGSILVLILALAIGTALVSAQGGDLPGSGWESGQQIQNTSDTDQANITFVLYDQDGNATDCTDNSKNPVQPGASVNYLTEECPVAEGFQGSAVVSADSPIAAIVNVNNRTVGAAAGQYRGTDGSDVSTTIAFPLVKNDYFGRTTTFYVQNASSQPNDISATFNTTSGTNTHDFTNVPANAMVIFMPSDAGVPAGDVGSLVVEGTQPVAGTSLEHEASAAVAANLQASKAFTPSEYDSTAYCPLIRNNHTARNLTTGIQAQNVSGSPQTITVAYSYSVGGGPVQTSTATSPQLADGESHTFFYQGPNATLPEGALGSATVTGDEGGNIAVVVNDRGFALDPSPVTTYACFPDSGTSDEVVVPLYKEYFFGNTTGIQVQNVGASDVTVELTYTPVGGSPVTISHSQPIAPGASKTFFGVSQGTSPADITGTNPALVNTYGGIVITANGPVVAMANEGSFGGFGTTASGQDNKNYEGFNQ